MSINIYPNSAISAPYIFFCLLVFAKHFVCFYLHNLTYEFSNFIPLFIIINFFSFAKQFLEFQLILTDLPEYMFNCSFEPFTELAVILYVIY